MKNISDEALEEVFKHPSHSQEGNQRCFLIAMSRASEGKRKRVDQICHGDEQSRKKDSQVDREHGMRCESQPETGQHGDRVYRPEVPLRTKWKGDIGFKIIILVQKQD